jgi:hypothetical protein
LPSADDLIVERAKSDFEEGFAHTRERIRATHGRFAGAALDALVTGAVAALHVRARMADDVRELIRISRRVAKGEDARELGAAHLDHVLRMKRGMHLIAREDDPEFQHVRKLALDIIEARLPDLATMAAVDGATDYPDLVRKAFPDRARVDAIVEDNAARVGAILDHLEKHPHVLRMPVSMAPKLAATSREFLAWKVADVKKGVDAIYSPSTTGL